METSRTRVCYLLLLLPFIYFQIFYGLGSLGLVGPDEPRYAEVAKGMLRNGDYVTPRLSGQPWLEKPILYFWITTLSFRLFGVNELAARLASALAATLGVIAVVLIGNNWIGFRGGVHAALILLSCVLYFSLARAASMDMLLTGTLTTSWVALYFVIFQSGKPITNSPAAIGAQIATDETREKQTHLIALSYFSLALTVLAKGPVGLALWGGVLVAFLLLTRRFQLIKTMRIGLGIAILIAVAGPWYWLCYRANGPVFVKEFLLRQNFERFTTDRYQHLQPFWFYLAVIFAGSFPWAFQLFAPVGRFLGHLSKVKSDPAIAKTLYLWLWLVVPLVFFSLSKAKLPGYILPIAPSIALLVAREFEMASNRTLGNSGMSWFRWVAFSQALLICLMGLTLPFTTRYLNIQIGAFASQLQEIFISVGVLGLILVYLDRIRLLLASYLTGTVVTVLLIVNTVIPRLDPLESARQLAFMVKHEGFSGQPIFLLGLSRRVEYGLNFYLDTTTRVIYSEDDLSSTERETFLLTPIGFELRSALSRFKLKSAAAFHGQTIMKLGSRENPPLPAGQAP